MWKFHAVVARATQQVPAPAGAEAPAFETWSLCEQNAVLELHLCLYLTWHFMKMSCVHRVGGVCWLCPSEDCRHFLLLPFFLWEGWTPHRTVCCLLVVSRNLGSGSCGWLKVQEVIGQDPELLDFCLYIRLCVPFFSWATFWSRPLFEICSLGD